MLTCDQAFVLSLALFIFSVHPHKGLIAGWLYVYQPDKTFNNPLPPEGDIHYIKGRDAHWEISNELLKGTNLGVA